MSSARTSGFDHFLKSAEVVRMTLRTSPMLIRQYPTYCFCQGSQNVWLWLSSAEVSGT